MFNRLAKENEWYEKRSYVKPGNIRDFGTVPRDPTGNEETNAASPNHTTHRAAIF
jgi:hypothetical protein